MLSGVQAKHAISILLLTAKYSIVQLGAISCFEAFCWIWSVEMLLLASEVILLLLLLLAVTSSITEGAEGWSPAEAKHLCVSEQENRSYCAGIQPAKTAIPHLWSLQFCQSYSPISSQHRTFGLRWIMSISFCSTHSVDLYRLLYVCFINPQSVFVCFLLVLVGCIEHCNSPLCNCLSRIRNTSFTRWSLCTETYAETNI